MTSIFQNLPNFVERTKDFPKSYKEVTSACKRRIWVSELQEETWEKWGRELSNFQKTNLNIRVELFGYF